MGLDMYLKAEKHVGAWQHADPQESRAYHAIMDSLGLSGFQCDGSPSATVSFNVVYWRKANAIHRWFVQNCQTGEDEGQYADVTREQLNELIALCEKVLGLVETVEGDINLGTTYYPDGRVEHHTKRGQVLAQPEIAGSLLPTQSGFFFGSTDYNECYLNDLSSTVKQLRAVLDDPRLGDCFFKYHASW